MFYTETRPFGPLQVCILGNRATGEEVGIIPGYGAALNSAKLRVPGGQLVDVVAGSVDHEHLMGPGTQVYKGMVLFPFPNRIKDGKYNFGGKAYQLPVNEADRGHALHTLLYNRAFKVVSHDADDLQARLILRYDGQPEEAYPHHYTLWLEFRLVNGGGLVCVSNVQNTGHTAMPFGYSYHPYFQIGSNLDELTLQMPSLEMLELDGRMIPTGKKHVYNQYHSLAPMKGLELDNCFTLSERSVISEMVMQDAKNNLNLHIWQQTGQGKFNYLQIYTPPHRRSIAIEPMSCAPDAINNGMGLNVLQPGQWWEAAWGFRLSAIAK